MFTKDNDMRYAEYISSSEWARKRKARLEIDGYHCRLCSSKIRLEVHHNPDSYKYMPEESVDDDLTTLCHECHELITSKIRGERYDKKKHVITFIEPVEKTLHGGNNNDLESKDIQTDWIDPVTYAQRAISSTEQQVVTFDERDHVKAKQDGRRL